MTIKSLVSRLDRLGISDLPDTKLVEITAALEALSFDEIQRLRKMLKGDEHADRQHCNARKAV